MKYDLHPKLVNDFELTKEYSQHLESYYRLHWSVLYLFRKLTEREDGLIEHNGKLFVPVLKSESFPLDSKAQAVLSFRVPREITRESIPNYVLIKPL